MSLKCRFSEEYVESSGEIIIWRSSAVWTVEGHDPGDSTTETDTLWACVQNEGSDKVDRQRRKWFGFKRDDCIDLGLSV